MPWQLLALRTLPCCPPPRLNLLIVDVSFLAHSILRYIATLAEWQGLQSIAMVQSERRVGEETTVRRRYSISSLESDAKLLLHAVRIHRGIENKVHWVLDIAFREEDCRIRKGNGAENFVLRHIALNLLRREASAKRSLRAKRKKAAWDEQYLLKVLTG